MAIRSAAKAALKSPEPRVAAEEHHRKGVEEQGPRNMPPNTYPTEGFSLEVDGKLKSQHPTADAATKIGAELKRKFPVLKVTIYDAAAKTRTLVQAAG